MPFIGAYAAARIVKATGEQVDLIGQANSWVTSVSVTVKNGSTCAIEVGIDMPYRRGIEVLEDDLLNIGNILMARVGYSKSGYMSPWYSCIMMQPQVQLSANGLSGTLNGDGAGALAIVQGSGKTWGPTTRWEIVQSIAAKYGWEVAASTTCRSVLTVDEDYSDSQGGLDDWSFLKRTCEGRNVYITSLNSLDSSRATLALTYKNDALAGQPRRTFVLMRSFDLAKNEYPVVSFSCESEPGTVFNNAASRGVKHQSLDENADVVELSSDPSKAQPKALAEGSVQTGLPYRTFVDPTTGLLADTPVDDGSDVEAVAENIPDLPHADQEAMDAYVSSRMDSIPTKITIESVGIPNMQPWELNEVRGASARYDGRYYADSVVHRVDSGGFSTTWTGMRNALSKTSFPLQNADVNATLPMVNGELLDVPS